MPYDFGPVYAETNMARFPVEPWNTASNVIFLFVIIYFAIKSRSVWRHQGLILTSLPILLAGFVGGTLYHATRSSNLWLKMDYMSIFLLGIGASICLWRGILKSWVGSVGTVIILLSLRDVISPFVSLSRNGSISLGYVALALCLVVPAMAHCRQNSWEGSKTLAASLVLIALALACRSIDSDIGLGFLPMGTHFLWHLCGGLSVFCFMSYLFSAGTPSILGLELSSPEREDTASPDS